MEQNYEPVEHEPYDVEAAQAAEDREAEKYDIDKDWEYWNERRIISSISRGHNDRPCNHRGGSLMIGYNTGKLVIGKYHQKPQKAFNDDLNIFWQYVLLGRKKSLLERFREFCGG
jgi:hypothetical protein